MLKVNRIRALPSAEQTSDDYVLDDQPGYLLRIARRRHTIIFAKHMIEGLTAPQFSTLAKLREVGACSQNYLGRLIYFDSATMKGVVDRLLARGLIAIALDPSDKRRRAIMLTKKGQQVIEKAIVAVRKSSSEHFAALTESERRTLVKLLKKII
ncbi:MarR family transcriptional regulator [Bradyrhizobium sp. NP1]|uniref:MarR family winged helix-turn-helix transcriptional regulator n=1 Tax=Bradyrhizobium sp. NP1 TaxID=3049772 RepID=UPI0025A6669E|nr:MarR family transcriptional regulator [Bradyrhizobium sp. NP1]WJR79894.1 MarR family transcriptional regulator [Bradyrhizobium sp. NP1]